MNIRDVIISGAGPAGSSLAYFLSKEGFDVLLLDKALFPRAKPCAGAFQISLSDFFPFSFEQIVEDKVNSFSFKKNGHSCDVSMKKPIGYTVDRKKFDDFLLRKAIDVGAKFIEECRVLRVDGEDVYSNLGKFKGRIVVGAEGVGSVVRRFGKYGRIKSMLKTISADIPFSFKKELVFDFSYTKGGYAWIFPKGKKTHVGIATSPRNFKDSDAILSKILDDYGLPETENIYKWTYPIFSSQELLVYKNTLLIGDAAALANPATSGGIYNAVQSAYLASKAINFNLREGRPLKVYQDMIRKHMYLIFYASRVFDYLIRRIPFTESSPRILKPILTYLAKKLM